MVAQGREPSELERVLVYDRRSQEASMGFAVLMGTTGSRMSPLLVIGKWLLSVDGRQP